MKRARRQTIASGLTARQRRRLSRLLASVGPDGSAGLRARWAVRDARRLAEAGLAVAVASKCRPWGPQPTEVTLYRSEAEALRRYPRSCLMLRGRTE